MDPRTKLEEFSTYVGMIFVDDSPYCFVGSVDLDSLRKCLRPLLALLASMALEKKYGKVQIRVLNRFSEEWVDLSDGLKAAHPDGWANVELRIMAGRGPI